MSREVQGLREFGWALPCSLLSKTNNNYWFLTSNNNHNNYNNYWFLTSKSTIIIIVDLLFLATIFFICVLLYLKNTCAETLHVPYKQKPDEILKNSG